MEALLTGAAALILVASTLGHLGPYFWVFELFDQFQLHALVAGTLLLLTALLWRLKPLRLLALGVMLSSGVTVLPVLYAVAPQQAEGKAKIISYNVLSTNPQQAEVAQWLRAQEAEVVALIEANARWNEMADSLRDLYPHQYRLDDPGNFGQILLSRVPLENPQVVAPQTPLETGMIQADVILNQQPVRLLLVHPTPPLFPALRQQGRDSQIRHIAQLVQQSPLPVLVMGDFNAAPWTAIMRELRDTAALQNFNVLASWPAPLGPFGLPIDHILARYPLQLSRATIGPALGSDHRAVITQLY